jgi:hypothetical protein
MIKDKKNTKITDKLNSNVIGEVNPVMVPTSSVSGIEKLVYLPLVSSVALAPLEKD